MRGGWVIILGLACGGCVEAPLEGAVASPMPEESPPVQQSTELAPPGDSFWLAEAIAEARKPPPVRARSISLGYVGNAPLVGGVMRDTPMSDAPPPPEATCSCALR